MQFAIMSSQRHIGGFESTPGTPFKYGRMSSGNGGLSGMGVSGKQGDGQFSFRQSAGTYAQMGDTPSSGNFGGMGLSSKGTFNFGHGTIKGMTHGRFGTQHTIANTPGTQYGMTPATQYGMAAMGMSGNSVSRQGSMSQFGSYSNFGRQRTGTVTTPHQNQNSSSITGRYGLGSTSTPKYSTPGGRSSQHSSSGTGKTPKYGPVSTPNSASGYHNNTSHAYRPSNISTFGGLGRMGTLNSNVSSSGMGMSMTGIGHGMGGGNITPTPMTPEIRRMGTPNYHRNDSNDGQITPTFNNSSQVTPTFNNNSSGGRSNPHGALSGMGGSFSKFAPMGGLDSPQLQQQDSAKFDFGQSGGSYSMAPNQKHDNL